MKAGKEKRFYILSLLLIAIALGFMSGWLARGGKTKKDLGESSLSTLRLSGYEYINPLLVCDTETDEDSEVSKRLERLVGEIIDRNVRKGNISQASVYYRDLSSGVSANINEAERYYPASLSKIPVMMAIFKISRNNPDFLNKEILWNNSTDYNASQIIKPQKFLENGKSYRIIEAIEYMIKYSDNNSFYFLTENIDKETFNTTFSDLLIPIRDDPNSSPDYITAKQFSYFFRVLYNATYLNRQYSETSLKLLSEIDYKNALVAGLPEGTKVAHKYGYSSMQQDGTWQEFHDCGLVYKKENAPYLLCIMTKSKAELTKIEDSVKEISAAVYNIN
ncbi:MAG: hypothetical protein BWY19_00145 [bacterium ADurb.Bin212]|nr:MAG: hypothetical protein BWY19_00145 [bacterium ADurb.Bin212]